MPILIQKIAICAFFCVLVGCGRRDHPGMQPPNNAKVPQNEDAALARTTEQGLDLADEQRLLEEGLDQKCEELEKKLPHSTGEQRAATLNQIAMLGTARAIEIVSKHYNDLDSNWQYTLINIVAGTGHPASVPLLLRIARDGNVGQRAHVVERLYVACGKDARDHLLALRESEEHPQVQYVIRQELLKLKDAALIADLRQHLTSLNRKQLEDLQDASGLLSLATEAHCTEVAKEVGDLFQKIDWSQSDGHRRLKQQAAAATLWLGHRASVGHIIDLLEDPGSDRFDDAGIQSLEQLLQMYTKQEFQTIMEWNSWWNREGEATALFTEFLRPNEEAALLNAVLKWGRSQHSGPFIEEETVYLMAPSKSCWDRRAVWDQLTGNVRVYSPVEIEALGVRPYSIQDISSNGTKAYATFGDGRIDFKWRLVHLELEMDNGNWIVRKLPN